MKKYDFFLFDFDGTLFDTWVQIHAAMTRLGSVLKIKEKIKFSENYFSHLNRREMLNAFLGKEASLDEEAMFIALYRGYLSETKVFNGIERSIESINKNSKKWGVVTNKPRIYVDEISRIFEFMKSSVVIICAEDVKNKKPDPEGLINACRSSGFDISRTLFIGDGRNDWLAATSCLMDFGLANYGYVNLNQEERTQCRLIFNGADEIENLAVQEN